MNDKFYGMKTEDITEQLFKFFNYQYIDSIKECLGFGAKLYIEWKEGRFNYYLKEKNKYIKLSSDIIEEIGIY